MRILNFTDPYYDELFYSSLARYQYYTRGKNSTQIIQELFQQEPAPLPKMYFLSNLSVLSENLGEMYSEQTLLNKYTLYPYFSPFLDSTRRDKVLYSLREKNARNNTSLLVGMCNRTPGITEYELRYCPECVKADLETYGESYFHRSHHLPGIEVCPIHGCYLKKYPLWKREDPLKQYVRLDSNRLILESETCSNLQELRLARSAEQVLHHEQDLDLSYMVELLKQNLKNKGYLNGKGNVKKQNLYRDLEEFYSMEYLKQKGVTSVYSLNNWIIWDKNGCDIVVAPYKFLLLVNFLCEDFTAFLKTEFKQPEEKVFKCINPVCPHFNNEAEGPKYAKFEGDLIITSVRCSCGTVYSHKSSTDKKTILQYGHLWIDTAKGLRDQGRSVYNVAKTLNMDQRVLKSQLNKPDPTPIDTRIKQSREQLCELLKENPNLSRRQFSKQSHKDFYTLFTYDRDWLYKMLPLHSTAEPGRTGVKKSYEQEDREYYSRIKEIVEEQLEVVPLRRITKKLILKELGISYPKLKRLPRSEELINESVESKVDFDIRKGKRAIDKFVTEEIEITKANLTREGVHDASNPVIYDAIMEYLKRTYL